MYFENNSEPLPLTTSLPFGKVNFSSSAAPSNSKPREMNHSAVLVVNKNKRSQPFPGRVLLNKITKRRLCLLLYSRDGKGTNFVTFSVFVFG